MPSKMPSDVPWCCTIICFGLSTGRVITICCPFLQGRRDVTHAGCVAPTATWEEQPNWLWNRVIHRQDYYCALLPTGLRTYCAKMSTCLRSRCYSNDRLKRATWAAMARSSGQHQSWILVTWQPPSDRCASPDSWCVDAMWQITYFVSCFTSTLDICLFSCLF